MRIKVDWPGHSVMLSRRTVERAEQTGWTFPPLEGEDTESPGKFELPPEFEQMADLQDRLYDAGEDCGLSGFWDFVKAFYLSPGVSVALTLPDSSIVWLTRIPH